MWTWLVLCRGPRIDFWGQSLFPSPFLAPSPPSRSLSARCHPFGCLVLLTSGDTNDAEMHPSSNIVVEGCPSSPICTPWGLMGRPL